MIRLDAESQILVLDEPGHRALRPYSRSPVTGAATSPPSPFGIWVLA